MYEFGKIVLVPFPFTDLSSQKLRPALIISKSLKASEDIILLFITSRTPSDKPFIHPLLSKEKGFSQTGLKVDSFIRCDKIATLNKQVVLGEIGSLPPQGLRQVGKLFWNVFGF